MYLTNLSPTHEGPDWLCYFSKALYETSFNWGQTVRCGCWFRGWTGLKLTTLQHLLSPHWWRWSRRVHTYLVSDGDALMEVVMEGSGTSPPSSAFVIRGMWAELVTPHWADHSLLLMVMKSVDLHAVCEPGRLAPGGFSWTLREPTHPGRSWLCCCVLVHTPCRTTSEPGLVNRSHVDSHVVCLLWVFVLTDFGSQGEWKQIRIRSL